MLTLCVPTRNRSRFVARLLDYYAGLGFPHTILVGDSSEAAELERTRRAVVSVRDRLQVQHLPCPGLTVGACLERLSECLDTRFCAYVADDDFLLPSALEACIAFLENHADYSAAHGLGIMFSIGPADEPGRFRCWAYPQAVVQAETGAERLREFLTPPTQATMFSVHRVEVWREQVAGLSAITGGWDIFRDELIPSCLTVIQGKIGEIEELYLVRESHAGSGQPQLGDTYDWLLHPCWSSVRQFESRLLGVLVAQGGIAEDLARDAVKRAFWSHLVTRLDEDWRRYNMPRTPSMSAVVAGRLKALARGLPGATRLWQLWRSRIGRARREYRLTDRALQNRRSSYYEEFLPVFRAVISANTTE